MRTQNPSAMKFDDTHADVQEVTQSYHDTDDHPATLQTSADRRATEIPEAVVIPAAEIDDTSRAYTRTKRSATAKHQRDQVHIARDLLDLVSLSDTPEDATEYRTKHEVHAVDHWVLIVGLVLSISFMLIGIGLNITMGRGLPDALPDMSEVLHEVGTLSPAGFLALGLLVLIVTPILRVIGSIGAFLYERDWRYARIAGIVLIIMIVSIVFGKG